MKRIWLLFLVLVLGGAQARCCRTRCAHTHCHGCDGRFDCIKVSPEEAHFQIEFWQRQLSEHAFFLYLMLEDDCQNGACGLKLQAKKLHEAFECFIERHARCPDSMKVMNQILPLAEKLQHFKIHVRRYLRRGEWIGWIYPAFIDHALSELDYFVDKLNGIELSVQEEIKFWNQHHGEEAGLAARLLDPSESATDAELLSKKFQSIPDSEEEMFMHLSLKAADELDALQKKTHGLIKRNSVKSIIHPVLLDHAMRETDRGIMTLRGLRYEK